MSRRLSCIEIINYLDQISDEEGNSSELTDLDESENDLSEENIEFNDHSDESEIEGDNEDLEGEGKYDFVLGKDLETVWCLSEVAQVCKTRKKYIVKKLPGPRLCARYGKTEIEEFLKITNFAMIDEITMCTNKYIQGISNRFSRETVCTQTSRTEIMAMFRVLYMIGTKKESHTNVKELWVNDGTGLQLMRAVMSYKRFLFLLRCIRFDDSVTRSERRKTDKFAPFRSLLHAFVKNCIECYNTSEFVTIDEMLHPFRGQCSFIQYMPKKPAKYGLKFYALCNTKTFYCSNFEVYCVKQPQRPYKVGNTALEIVQRLIIPLEVSNKNVTIDNWYTSILLLISYWKRALQWLEP